MVKFVMMIGVSGAGKSTEAEKIAKEIDGVVLSSDKIREELYGDENIQGNPKVIFSLMEERTFKLLGESKNVIYDATNLNKKRRVEFLNKLEERFDGQLETEAVVILASYETLLKHQKMRDRQVPEEVVRRQFNSAQFPFTGEGWDIITIINNSLIFS